MVIFERVVNRKCHEVLWALFEGHLKPAAKCRKLHTIKDAKGDKLPTAADHGPSQCIYESEVLHARVPL